jgi:hypothetical protein
MQGKLRMGECGCGELNNYEAFKVGNYVLAIEKYLGCRYCHTGLIFSLHLFTEENAEEYLIVADKEFKPDEFGHAQIDFPIPGTEK